MAHELTHASFFSGVGGLDLGLERAGWRTVSFSEIDFYASAVLAERWPGVPNLGDIVRLAERGRSHQLDATDGAERDTLTDTPTSRASLWSGGFPCQDLSVAGKRAGFAGERSSLAFAFLDLVERHRPPAILLENVPGLLSSHRGRDFAALLGRLGQLGYWWAYRILDARHFGVPQRRRRVFIVALHSERGFGPDSAAAVLSVGSRCGRHPATGHATGEGAAGGAVPGVDIARAVTGTSGERHDDDTDTLIGYGDPWASEPISTRPGGELSPPPDPSGVRAPDGLAGRMDDRERVVNALAPVGGGPDDNDAQAGHLVAFRKAARPTEADGVESWVDDGLANTLNAFDTGDIRSTHIVIAKEPQDDPLLPLGLDSHRYRCCGNGVVSSVSEWVGWRLRKAVTVPAATPGASPE